MRINPRPASKGTETCVVCAAQRRGREASIHDPHRRVLKLALGRIAARTACASIHDPHRRVLKQVTVPLQRYAPDRINPRPASKGTETGGIGTATACGVDASIHDPHRRVLKQRSAPSPPVRPKASIHDPHRRVLKRAFYEVSALSFPRINPRPASKGTETMILSAAACNLPAGINPRPASKGTETRGERAGSAGAPGSINPRPASKGTETRIHRGRAMRWSAASIHDPHRRVLKPGEHWPTLRRRRSINPRPASKGTETE